MKRSKVDDEKLKQIEEKRKKLEDEKRKKEEDRLKKEEEKKKRDEEKERERLRKEEEKKKREEERIKREEEKKRQAEEKEQERLKREEEKRKKLEEKEQERLKREEEKRKKDEERKLKEEEKERERIKREEEKKQKDEEKERERLKREEEKLKKEQQQEEAERKLKAQADFLLNFVKKTPTRKSGGSKSYRPDGPSYSSGAGTEANDDEVEIMEVSENDNPNPTSSTNGTAEFKPPLPPTPKSQFRPFQVKNGMALAPLLRRPSLNSSEKTSVDKVLSSEEDVGVERANENEDKVDSTTNAGIGTEAVYSNGVVLMEMDTYQPYLQSIKKGKGRKSQRTEVQFQKEEEDDDDEVKIISPKTLIDNPKEAGLIKWRYKLLQFHDNNRPAYWGTWKKKTNFVKARKPLGRDMELDYEFDSDDEWEDEPEDGEDLGDKDDDDKAEDEKESAKVDQSTEGDDDDEEDGWMVPHGYLSDDEGDGVEYRDKDYLKSQEQRFYQDLKREEKLGLPVAQTENLEAYKFIFPPKITQGSGNESFDDTDEE